MKEEFYLPNAADIRFQSEVNKQGRSDEEVPAGLKEEFVKHLKETDKHDKHLYAEYQKFVEAGLARELARINLPLSLYTEWYWKIDLHNLFHFLSLRMDEHAQKEIKVYADVMATMVEAVCPMAYEAFRDYRLNSYSFSGVEMNAIKERLADYSPTEEELVKKGLSKREAREFLEKLRKIQGD
jgi:thymidylate synthase (FAD)